MGSLGKKLKVNHTSMFHELDFIAYFFISTFNILFAQLKLLNNRILSLYHKKPVVLLYY